MSSLPKSTRRDVLKLYKSIMQLHKQKLPIEQQRIGRLFVRDEFDQLYKHPEALAFTPTFIEEWDKYRAQLSSMTGKSTGRNMTSDEIKQMGEDQLKRMGKLEAQFMANSNLHPTLAEHLPLDPEWREKNKARFEVPIIERPEGEAMPAAEGEEGQQEASEDKKAEETKE